ncbi:MAG: hypothetical protein K2Z81_17045 [Cyanobacteria bacterium]|nr:hypothetical protein [Cyanobacteriota bacterium]
MQSAPDTKELRTSFKLGAASRLQARVLEMREQEKKTHGDSSGNTLVLMRNQFEQDLADAIRNMKVRNKHSRSVSVDSSTFDMGQKYGDTIGLERQLSTCSSRRIEQR